MAVVSALQSVLVHGVLTLALQGPALPPGGLSSHAGEEAWIASSIVRDIVDMATLGLDPSPAPTVTVTGAGWQTPTTIHVAASGPAAFNYQGKLDPHAWAPAAYAPIAREVLTRAGRKPGPSAMLNGALARLTDLKVATLVQESDRIGARLSSHPLDAHAHEEAALTFVAFALRERAGELSDVRHGMNRATAHLALADALRPPTGESATGRIARIGLEVLAGRQVLALAALEKARGFTGPEQAWVRALKLRITEDWRATRPEHGTLLERLHAYAAFKKSIDGPRALEYLRTTKPEPIADWGWIALETVSYFSVEEGNTFGRGLLSMTLAELAAALGPGGPPLDAARIAAAVDAVPGPAVRQSGNTRKIEVLDAATWGQFYGRHLLQSAQMSDYYFRTMLGQPAESDAFWAEAEKHLGRMVSFPAITSARQQQLGRWKPEAGNPSASSLQAQCAAFVQHLNRAPETVMPAPWLFFLQVCDRQRADGTLPNPSRWFARPALPGTAQAAGQRIRNLGVPPQYSLAPLKAMAPYDEAVVLFARRQGAGETAADVVAAYGPRVEYSIRVLRRAAAATPDLAEKLIWQEKACALAADECLEVGQSLAARGDTPGAVRAFEKAFREARDRVNVSNKIAWLARHYLAHGQKEDAERIARDVAGVFSSAGLQLGAEILEGLGRLDEAERLFLARAERYADPTTDPNDAEYFYIRAARRPGGERFAARSRQAMARLFPRGLERVALGQLSGPPLDGAVIISETADSARLGVHKDDVIVALDGFRVRSAVHYRAIRALSDDPRITVIVWDGRQYKEVQGSFARRSFGSLFGDFRPEGAKP